MLPLVALVLTAPLPGNPEDPPYDFLLEVTDRIAGIGIGEYLREELQGLALAPIDVGHSERLRLLDEGPHIGFPEVIVLLLGPGLPEVSSLGILAEDPDVILGGHTCKGCGYVALGVLLGHSMHTGAKAEEVPVLADVSHRHRVDGPYEG